MIAFQPGDRIGGRYRLIQEMGAGAMGTVWSARNEATERDFALKLMLPESARDPQRVARFFKEAKIAGRLRHRCIVEVYDLGRIDEGPATGAPYLVMELLVGEPLDALLRRMGRMPAGTVVHLLRDLARGLDVAHRQAIVHRDLKPANIFLHQTLEARIVPKILDFGVSKLLHNDTTGPFDAQETTVGTILGSPAYMSPEQTAGDEVDARADIWALGVIAYRCISGAFPFAGANFTALALAINTTAPTPLEQRVPTLPGELCDIVARCLSRDRAHRYPSAAALADALDDLVEHHELPLMELSAIVGQGLPSDLMKTAAKLARSLRPPASTTTQKLDDTRPLDSTRPEGSNSAANDPQAETLSIEQEAPRDLEATAGIGSSVAVPASTEPFPRRRRAAIAGAVFVAIAAVVTIGLVGRSTPPADPPSIQPEPTAKAAAETAPTTSAPSTAPSVAASTSATPSVLAKKEPAAPKKAPPPAASVKSKPKDQPHDGLVNPGF